jgi:hypothetical protein
MRQGFCIASIAGDLSGLAALRKRAGRRGICRGRRWMHSQEIRTSLLQSPR